MKGVKIAIYHFAPLEYFPPVQNMVNAITTGLAADDKLIVYTTAPKKEELLFKVNDKRVRIIRTGNFSFGLSVFERYATYIMHYLKSFISTVVFHPKKLLYYETISSMAPILYRTLVSRSAELFIHYHEYMTPEEYRGMYLNSLLLNWEKKIYDKAKWISHTNKERLELFCRDTGYGGKSNIHELPNYPPADWKVTKHATPADEKLKLVYVGSFGSLETIYIREIIEWVSLNSDQVSLDIYSNNITKEVQHWIDLEPRNSVTIKGNLPYKELPLVLPSYDTGLILYKGVNINFIFNAPNKLFEYLVCGLEVWYPMEMLGIYPYDCDTARPQVIRCDFSRLGKISRGLANDSAGLPFREINFRFEDIAAPLLQKLLNRKTSFSEAG